jgi:hypothetical protein
LDVGAGIGALSFELRRETLKWSADLYGRADAA